MANPVQIVTGASEAPVASTNPLSVGIVGTSSATVTASPAGVPISVYNNPNGTVQNLRGTNTGYGYVVAKPDTTGGLTPARVITGTTGVIKASAGQAYRLWLLSTNAAVRYLHLYNKASAPTLSTDTPVMTFPLTQNVPVNIDLGGSIGAAFSAGIAWAYTTDNVAIPTTAGTSGELQMTALYA